MHIEPGLVGGAKIGLSYENGVGSLGLAAKMSYNTIHSTAAPRRRP